MVDLINTNAANLKRYTDNERRRGEVNAFLNSSGGSDVRGPLSGIRDTIREGVLANIDPGDVGDYEKTLTAKGFYKGKDIGYHSIDLGCAKDCIGYRSTMGSMGISDSVQIVINRTLGVVYIDRDRFNPRQDVRGALGLFFIEILGKGGVSPRPALLNRAAEIRAAYNR